MLIATNCSHAGMNKTGRILLFLCLVILITLPVKAYSEKSISVLVYPQTNTSYARVIDAIIKGMEKSGRVSLSKYEISDKTTVNEINELVNGRSHDAIISLGSYALGIINRSSPSIPVIAGATLLDNDSKAGISLIGNPDEFMRLLRQVAPGVRRVHVVYNKHNSEWYIKKAIVAANSRGITLRSYQADSVNEAAVLYKEIMTKAVSSKDAVWILMDRVVPQKVVLPEILHQAWDKNIVTFSSNPLHVKQGVLFALYPDYEKVGYDLAELTGEVISNSAANAVYPATGMKTSVNVRTASHLGLRISPLQLEKFDSVFPEH